jgi:transcriptional regulator with XRE-family HTH domain
MKGRNVFHVPHADPWREMARNLGLRVRDLRHRRGLTQEALVDRIDKIGPPLTGMGRSNLARLEAGRGGLPGLRVLVSLARGLDVPIGTLLVGVDEHV